jgi:hypothetical protein
MPKHDEQTEKKARIIIDIEDLREITADQEGDDSDPANAKVAGGRKPQIVDGVVQSTVMCPW